jgi:hypothetical protein
MQKYNAVTLLVDQHSDFKNFKHESAPFIQNKNHRFFGPSKFKTPTRHVMEMKLNGD